MTDSPRRDFPSPEMRRRGLPDPKDVIIGILGSSGALAGLLLVFSGFVFSQAASFPDTTPDAVIKKYTKAGRLALCPFICSLLTTLLALSWLLDPTICIFWLCVGLFAVLVVGIGIYGTLVSYRYL
jgi:hypothetical protein